MKLIFFYFSASVMGSNLGSKSNHFESRRRLWLKHHHKRPIATSDHVTNQISTTPEPVSINHHVRQSRPAMKNFSRQNLCDRFHLHGCGYMKTVFQKTFWNKYNLSNSHRSPILQSLMT